MSALWNPWHGCCKLSDGCKNCYVYRIDASHEKNASEVKKNVTTFNEPIKKNRSGEYKHPSGTFFYTCFSSDFFLEDADAWRGEAWRILCDILIGGSDIYKAEMLFSAVYSSHHNTVIVACHKAVCFKLVN